MLSRVFPWFIKGMGKGVSRNLLAFAQGDGTYMYQYERPRYTPMPASLSTALFCLEQEESTLKHLIGLTRYSWAETASRPVIPKPDGSVLCERLGAEWVGDYGGGMTQVLLARPLTTLTCAGRLVFLNRVSIAGVWHKGSDPNQPMGGCKRAYGAREEPHAQASVGSAREDRFR